KKPRQSNGRGAARPILGMKRRVSPMATRLIGTLRKKIQGQDRAVMIIPPSGGPITGATSAGVVLIATAVTILFLGVTRNNIWLPTGDISAAQAACSARAAAKASMLRLIPHRIDARVKPVMATASTRRGPNRSAIQAL